ncbi:hypothetical protein [Actinoplanes derwentensis]|uniref:Uncharacterized protein n=1 Tax=Actinoplanes derwentensis TaxID=113562 RepID=A0A1H2CV34_9ACTN|nr:hypothetical protein [Actinoplanes derwentensis]GID82010.1 hypothetical protein Ade03nite_09340 [Actinoplanes derwentensis]SDT74355.1 hypothetical protein SAMN04489716_6956 [Actinoplanes derwentensis]
MADDPAEERTVVYLGNHDPIEVVADLDDQSTTIRRSTPGPAKTYTRCVLPPGLGLLAAARDITNLAGGVWVSHSDAEHPAWVAASGPLGSDLAALLGAHWSIEIRAVDLDHTPGG